jgi:hypothetical protein
MTENVLFQCLVLMSLIGTFAVVLVLLGLWSLVASCLSANPAKESLSTWMLLYSFLSITGGAGLWYAVGSGNFGTAVVTAAVLGCSSHIVATSLIIWQLYAPKQGKSSRNHGKKRKWAKKNRRKEVGNKKKAIFVSEPQSPSSTQSTIFQTPTSAPNAAPHAAPVSQPCHQFDFKAWFEREKRFASASPISSQAPQVWQGAPCDPCDSLVEVKSVDT